MATTGRIQVSPGQTIQSAQWGNVVWDQSQNCFATAADRDTQWPNPHEGSQCWTDDTKTPWVYRLGAWYNTLTQSGFVTPTTDGAGLFRINYPRAFAGTGSYCAATPLSSAGSPYLLVNTTALIAGNPTNNAQFNFLLLNASTGAAIGARTFSLYWIARGN